MSCSCGLTTLPRSRSSSRPSYAPLSQALPTPTTEGRGADDCATTSATLRASTSIAGSPALLWEPAAACQTALPQWSGDASDRPNSRQHHRNSWLTSSGSFAATANWPATADCSGPQLRRLAAQTGRSVLAPVGLRRVFGTSPTIATQGSYSSGGVASSLTTASTSLRGAEERLLTPLTIDESQSQARCVDREHSGRAAGNRSGDIRNDDCWPLLAISLVLCAISLLLLAIGGLFLGVHLKQRTRSVAPSSSLSSVSAAAAAAAGGGAADSATTPSRLTTTSPSPASQTPAAHPLSTLLNSKDTLRLSDERISHRMQSVIDSTVGPCDNFHGYACGRLGEYLTRAVEDLKSGEHRGANNLLDLAGIRLRNELDVAMEMGAAPSSLLTAYRHCQLSEPAGACLRALRWAAPETTKWLTSARELNVTALHISLSDLFSSVVSELRDLVSVSPALTAHTRRWMDSRLSGLYLYVDSIGNDRSNQAATDARISFAISGFNVAESTDLSCHIDACRPSSPDWSFGSACICLSNATAADVAVPLSALRPELYAPSLSPSLAHGFMAARLAEAAFTSVGPAHRRRFYSTESEARASAAVGCLSRRLRLPPGGRLLSRSVARLVGLRAALAAFLGHQNQQQTERAVSRQELAAFFINWAQTQCSLADATSSRVINWAVVEDSAQSFSAFLHAFNCTAGDAMMPAERDDHPELCRFP